MNITKGLIKLGFIPNVDFVCQTDDNEMYIKEWLSDSPQPTIAEIESATNSAVIERDIEKLREVRNTKLAETDWVITMHKELGTNIPAAWKTYRQALRDITDTYTSLDDVVWPEKP